MSAPSWQTVLEDDRYTERVEVYIDGRTFYLSANGAITPEFINRSRFRCCQHVAAYEAKKLMRALGAAPFKPTPYHQALMAVRDNIAWRVAQNKPTSENERMILFAIDSELDKRSEPSATLPDEAREIMANLKGEDR